MAASKGLVTILVTLIVLPFILVAITSAAPRRAAPTTLAIEVGSQTTRMSVVGDTGLPKLISLGPGTLSAPRPLESLWSTEGFLLIKDGTDESFYVHPFNTLFNMEHPVAFTAQNLSGARPNLTGYQALTLKEITTKYLTGLKTLAETIIGRNITLFSVVMPGGNGIRTVEEHAFDWRNYTLLSTVITDGDDPEESRRAALTDAATAREPVPRFALRLPSKSIAAASGFYNGMEYDQTILVYRLGRSTFEVSVLSQWEGFFDILSSVYEPHLGGNNFNRRVIDHLLQNHQKKTLQDLSSDDNLMIRLEREVEKVKIALSSRNSVRIEIELFHIGGQDFSEALTRSQFENLNRDLFMRTISAIDRAIEDSTIGIKDNIQDIVLSGGSSHIPFLQSALKDYFGWEKNYQGLDHPETVTVFGAARLGQRAQHDMGNDGICCLEDSPLSLGIETAGGVMFRYSDQNGEFNKMLTFSTAMDNQDRVVIRVFEGERARTSQNAFLGGIELSGISLAPKGVPQIRVRLNSPSCGNSLYLTVMDVASKRINATTITPRSAYVHRKEINSKKAEGKAFEQEDRQIWENAEAAGTMTLLPAQ